MRQYRFGLLIVLVATVACICTPPVPFTLPTPATATEVSTTVPTVPVETAEPSPSPAPTLPPVVGPEPSYRVAAFYYPWYRTPDVDLYWDHWGETNFYPPLDIASDFYPVLGAYSIADPAVVAQHFAWLREAGVGVIVSSWWGRRSREDQAVSLLLDVAERYGIKVAFHIEPYGGRTAIRLVNDVRYLYSQYGDHSAFYRTTASSRWSPDGRSKGLFYLWSARFPDSDASAVEASYWREALDAIHALPDGGLVLADETVTDWVDGGHFDGLYSYAVLDLDEGDGYSWARGLPPEAWYVPGVNPGFSARRIRYPADLYAPRRDGATYEERWEAALDVGVEPALVTITSFNEWHEGTQIEPAAVGATNGLGYTYEDYGSLAPEGYLTLTRQWVDRFLETTWPDTHRVRIRLVTTSDWTTFDLVDGATWLRPSLVSASAEATEAWLGGNRLVLSQPIARAEAGGMVEMIVDILLSDTESGGTLVFEIERGHLGSTQVELSKYLEAGPVVVETFVWDGISSGERNAITVQIPAEALLNSAPSPTSIPATATPSETPEAADGADIVFRNGVILTLNGDQPRAQAIAIQGKKILAVGNDVDILALQGPQTRVVDLAGRTLLPGFVDGHTHILVFSLRTGKATLDEAQDIALRFGFTSVTEMWADEPFLEELMQAEEAGQLHLRVNVFASYNDGILQHGKKVFIRAWYPENDPILDSDRMLRIPGIKVFVDGASGGGRGCPALSEPYDPDFVATDWFRDNCGSDRGDLYWSQEEINQVVADVQAAGYRVAFHAMGDQGIETSLNAIEFALDGQPNERYRHQIQHNSLIRPDLLERYADLDILASLRGYFNACDQSGYITYHGPDRYEWNANRYTLPGLGIHVYLETDFAWDVDPADTYWSRNPNSMLHLYGLVTRQQVNQDGTICRPEPWLVPHAISVEQALRIMTIEPAYAVSQEDVLGTLEPGKFADLLILSDNPLTVDPDNLKNLEVWMTMVGGNVEWCAPGYEALCPVSVETR